MKKSRCKIAETVDNAERIGVVGSPSSTSGLTVDILGTAINKRLVGNLCIFNYNQEGESHFALSQITEIMMRNVWSEDPTVRGLIRQKGRIEPITGKQDVHTASMTVSSVFYKKNGILEPSILGTIPSTGTSVKLLDEYIMKNLFAEYEEELFYLGRAYGTNIKMPMWFKHFSSDDGGANEAYHIGIFGKTGSGKSILSMMMMMAYAKHANMTQFILDPQGEFTKNLKNQSEVKVILESILGREIEIYTLHDLVLTGWDLFKKILIQSDILDNIGIYHETNKIQAANEFVRILKKTYRKTGSLTESFSDESSFKPIPPFKAYKKESFDRIRRELEKDEVLARIYTSKDLRERIRTSIENISSTELYSRWSKFANLFKYDDRENSIKIKDLSSKISESRKGIIVIDLSEADIPKNILWNDTLKFIVIGEFLDKITRVAEEKFKENKKLNCLVIIDEAHRLAPRDRTENDELERVKTLLIDGVRTTRKYGLGWMFISQTLSSLDRRIIDQIRIYIFGFGLAWGVERQALLGIIGGQKEALRLYQMFRDPQSTLGEREYPFMTIGPISPLSFAGTPLFFTALKYPSEFKRINYKIDN